MGEFDPAAADGLSVRSRNHCAFNAANTMATIQDRETDECSATPAGPRVASWLMAFKVITDSAGGFDDYPDVSDGYRFLEGSGGVLQVDRADGTRLYYSPFGGWLKVEEADVDPERGGNVW